METKPQVRSPQDVRRLISEHNLEPGNQSQSRKLLEEGVNFIKSRIEFNKKSNSGLNVDDMGGWYKQMVSDKLGGEVRGTHIIWRLGDSTIILDPMSGEIECDPQ